MAVVATAVEGAGMEGWVVLVRASWEDRLVTEYVEMVKAAGEGVREGVAPAPVMDDCSAPAVAASR